MKYLNIAIVFLTLSAYGQNSIKMKTPENAKEKFAEFIAKEKFLPENYYPGIAVEKMRPILTKKVNQSAVDFQKISESKNPTNKKYHEKIKIGLARFTDVSVELDTEDRERVCRYFEELMDIIELKSSNGQLNKFMYGFDLDMLKEKN